MHACRLDLIGEHSIIHYSSTQNSSPLAPGSRKGIEVGTDNVARNKNKGRGSQWKVSVKASIDGIIPSPGC